MNGAVDSPLWQYRYRLTRDDVAAFEALRVEALRHVLVAVLVVGGLAGWYFDRIEQHLPFTADSAAGQMVVGIAIAGCGFLAARGIAALARRWRVSRYVLPEADTVVDVFGDHIAWSADGHDDRRPWERGGNIIATPDHVFILIDPSKALIMPLRAFESASDMAAFAGWADVRIS